LPICRGAVHAALTLSSFTVESTALDSGVMTR
jgi:hypothetical protein